MDQTKRESELVLQLQDILKAGVHPLLQQTPFRNPQTGAFDKDMLNKFLVDYAKMNESQMPAQYAEQYNNMYKYRSLRWNNNLNT